MQIFFEEDRAVQVGLAQRNPTSSLPHSRSFLPRSPHPSPRAESRAGSLPISRIKREMGREGIGQSRKRLFRLRRVYGNMRS